MDQQSNIKNNKIETCSINNSNSNNNSNNISNSNLSMIENGLNYYKKNNKQDVIPSKAQKNDEIDKKLSSDNLNEINQMIKECDELATAIVPNNTQNNISSTDLILPLNDKDNQELGAIAPSPTNSSLHNSTDNLSYTPDNNFYVGELLLYQNNVSDDDDDERSDNCVYAYRGGVGNDVNEFVMNLHHHNQYNQENDDETDFLEMDFDPDPLSEIEPQIFKDNHIVELQDNEFFRNNIRLNELKNRQENFSEINNSVQITPVKSNSIKLNNNENISNTIEDYELKSKLTGAKPKKVPIDNKTNDNLKSRKHNILQQKSLDSSVDLLLLSGSGDTKKQSLVNFNDLLIKDTNNDEMCLDCLEKEFLIKTVGNCTNSTEKQCMKCKIKNDNNSKLTMLNRPQCDYVFPILNDHDYIIYSNELNQSMKINENAAICLNQRRSSCTNLSADLINLKLHNEAFIFSTANVNATLLLQALEKIKVEYDEKIITNHFENERKIFNDVYELILYKSKIHSNYKKIIKLLKLASKDELDIIVESEITDTKFHVIQISANDIITCWNENNDLSKLITLDKRFAEMNVLGKIVNIIRKKQQKPHKLFKEYISVPQYYKTKNIILSKKY